MRADLLHEVAAMRDVTNAILLTHNIDFVFLQSVVMSYLRRCGDPALTILADATCATASYGAQREMLDGLGTRYRVVPMSMALGFVFHPKALLLSGPQEATLYVGSGNLTFGGWRQNGEVWSRYTASEDGRKVFEEFRDYVDRHLANVPFAGAIQAELEDAFDPRTKRWVASAPEGAPTLLGRAGGEGALLETMAAAIGSAPLDELVVGAPYFDGEGDALAALRARLPHVRGLLLHPARGSTLTRRAWERAGEGMARRPCVIRHSHPIADRPAFVHAKFYAAIRGDEAVVVQGSANCSRAALLMDGKRGNAELMTLIRTTAKAFRRDWLESLTEASGSEWPPEDDPCDDGGPPTRPALQILGARADGGVVLVAYHPPAAVVDACTFGDRAVPFTVLAPGQLRITHLGAVPALVLQGHLDGEPLVSPPHWVDQEQQLRASAHRRRLEEAIPRALGGATISSDQWIELLHVLGEHLAYTPARAGLAAPQARRPDVAPVGIRRYEDLFATRAPDERLAHWRDEPPAPEAHDSVRRLLLRWLGNDPRPAEPTAPIQVPSAEDFGGEGDQPERLPDVPRVPKASAEPAELAERMRHRLRQVLDVIESTVTGPEYLEHRPPDFLRSDVMMMSVILQFGHAQGWLPAEDFFEFTHAVWRRLFLSHGPEACIGSLERRRLCAPDPDAFITALASPQLSAALIAWSVIGLHAPPSPERARFTLARALSAARLPELWHGGSFEEIERELAEVLRSSHQSVDPVQVVTLWRNTVAQGEALRALEGLLATSGLAKLRLQVQAPVVEAAELLWQGKAGYCLTASGGTRTKSAMIDVLKLQAEGTVKFQGDMTLPVRSVLDLYEVANALEAWQCQALEQMLGALRMGEAAFPQRSSTRAE